MRFDIFDTVYFMHLNKVNSCIVLNRDKDNKTYQIDFEGEPSVPETELFATKQELIDSL